MANTIIKNLTDKTLVTPKGVAKWVKVNTRIDDYEGKKKYKITLTFPDKTLEAAMKKTCDDLLAKAKTLSDFDGKKWRATNDRCGYTENDDGVLEFTFGTMAFYKDKDTGADIQKFIPCLNMATKKKLGNDVAIGDGSEVRVSFNAGAYWSSKDSNGVSLYLNKIVVDKLVEFSGGDDFSEFGVEVASDADEFKDMTAADEDVPI